MPISNYYCKMESQGIYVILQKNTTHDDAECDLFCLKYYLLEDKLQVILLEGFLRAWFLD